MTIRMMEATGSGKTTGWQAIIRWQRGAGQSGSNKRAKRVAGKTVGKAPIGRVDREATIRMEAKGG
jgi:hypothetical protein